MTTDIIIDSVDDTNKKIKSESNFFGYGLGSLGKDLALGVISSYLLIFYTNVLGISAGIAGIIMVSTKVWDAVNDPIMGALVDRTKTRWGRFRPYLLFVPLPLAVFSALTFCAPDISYTGKVIYAFVTYTITGMLFTAFDVPLMGMVPVITNSPRESGKFLASARFFTSVAILLATTFAYPIIQKIGGGDSVDALKVGYPVFMVIVGVFSTIFGWVAFFSTKERPIIDKPNFERSNVFKEFVIILKHKPVLIVFFAMVFQALALIVPNTAGAFYMIYVMHKPQMIPLYFAITGGIGLLGAPLASLMIKYISAKHATMIAMAISAVLSIMAYFIPTTNMTLLFVLFGIYGLTVVVPMVSISVMMVQTAGFLYKKQGKRSDGTVFSLNSFAIKLGTALAGGLVGLVLAKTGFNPTEFMQNDSVIAGLSGLRTIMMAVIYIIGILIVSQFSVDKKPQ